MLNAMRENFRHLKWVLWIVAISMVLYLGYYFGGSGGGRRSGADEDWAAVVDDSTIGSREFLEAARRADEYYRQVLGDQYEQVREQLQLGRQVVQSLVDRRVMLAEARSLGLAASPAEVSREILSQPTFRDESGRFVGKQRYTAMVSRSYPGGVAAFERNLADDITIDKWRNLVTEPVRISDRELLDVYRSRSQRATMDLVVVPAAAQKISTQISDGDVRSWYETHEERYRRSEGRRVRWVVVARQAFLAKVQVADDDVRKYYEANREKMQRPEQRRARHILFSVPENAAPDAKETARRRAEEVLDRIRKGEDFAALARSLSEDPGSAKNGGDLGWFARAQMTPRFAAAAFDTPPGQLAPVVETEFGFHVLQVSDSRPAGAVPFDEVKDGIRRQLELQRAQEEVQTEARRLHEAAATPKDLDAAAARANLAVTERVVTRETPPADLGPSPEFLDTVLQMAPGTVSEPLGVAAGLAIVAAVEAVPASVAPLQEVRDQVRTEILNARAREAAATAARRTLASSADLAAAARALGTEVRTGVEIVPGRSLPGAGRSPELDRIAFATSAKAGDKGVVETESGALIYSIQAVQTFDPAKFEASKGEVRNELLGQRRAEVLQSILDGARQRHKIRINDEMVDRLRG